MSFTTCMFSGWHEVNRDGEIQAGPGGTQGLHPQQADQHHEL